MKVLHLTSHLNIGGITSYLYQLLSGCKKMNIDCALGAREGACKNKFLTLDIPVYALPFTKNVLSPHLLPILYALKKKHEKQCWEIIHAHTRVSQFAAHWLSKILHIPYVTTFHGHYNHHWGRQIFPCLGAQTIAVSHAVEADLQSHYIRHDPKISVILHGIDTDFFSPSRINLREKTDFQHRYQLQSVPTLGILSRLAAEKGHLELVDIFHRLLHQFKKPLQLLIIGEGREKNSILQRIKDLHLDTYVRIIPPQADPRIALSLVDIYVTYHRGPEGFGLSTLEAMALGKPVVIAYTHGGLGDFIEDGKNGFLLKNASPQIMIDKILLLLDQSDLRKNMGNTNTEKIRRLFSVERMTKETLYVYEKALAAH